MQTNERFIQAREAEARRNREIVNEFGSGDFALAAICGGWSLSEARQKAQTLSAEAARKPVTAAPAA